MNRYAVIHFPRASYLNAEFSGYLKSSTDDGSEYFLTFQTSEQERIRESVESGETDLEYGPLTADVLSFFLRLSGDEEREMGDLDEVDRTLTGYRVIDGNEAERIGLHPTVIQAIDRDLIQRVYVFDGDEFGDLYVVFETP